MKINRLVQVVVVSASVCAALPALAGSALKAHDPSPLCGADSDDDDDDGHDGDDDGDDGDDNGDDDGTETIEL